MRYFAIHNIDKFIYEKIYNKNVHKKGTFIEIGALDGVFQSNTLFFEKYFNWYGILVEPQTNHFNELIKNRNDRNYFFNYAIDKTEEEKEFIGNFATGGLVENMESGFIDAWHKNKETYKVQTIPFYKLTDDINIDKIDFFSLDTEGSELEVLETFDWNIHVNLLLIEISENGKTKENYRNKNKEQQCREILKDKNFEFYTRLGNNDLWINKNFKV